ncbi:MAG: outer membrane beta-barrel domain-containing protein [Deltaproteobacteria bacterium]|nr:outer membrane beta-barrel domain-containing protein [Deltaproteobacteria bacterium]
MHLRSSTVTRWAALTLALALLPARAHAQNSGDLGLDLSGDNGKKDSPPPVKPAADNPPDLSTPGDTASSTPAKKSDIDVGEHDVSLEDRVKSVQKKGFYKKNHFELAPHVGVSINDALFTKYNLGGAAIFHFSDNLALGGRFDYMIVQTTENVSTAKRELQSKLPVSKPKYGGAADFYWTPVYGKASLFNSIIHFDLFAIAGAGVVVSQTSSFSGTDPTGTLSADPLLNQGPHPAFDIGLGQRYALNEVVAFEWSLLETIYTDTPGGSGSSQVQRIMSLNAGFSFFLPPVRSE